MDRTRQISFKWLGVIPLVIALAALILLTLGSNTSVFHISNFPGQYLNIVLLGGASFLVAYLAWRGFAASGQVHLLLFGGGVLSLGMAMLLGSVLFLLFGQGNVGTTVYGTEALLSGILFLTGAVVGVSGKLFKPKMYPRRLGFVVYAIVLLMPMLVWALSGIGVIPVFYVPGQGVTLIRNVVLDTTLSLFVIAGFADLWLNKRTHGNFLYWYGMGLLLLATGLFAWQFIKVGNDSFTWLGRISQYVGGIYFIIAAISAIRESIIRHIPVALTIAEFFKQTRENYERTATEGDEISSDGKPEFHKQWSLSKWLGLVPLALIGIVTGLLAVSGARASLAPPLLFPILQTLFIFISYSVAAYYCARSFLRTGLWHMLLFGTGILILGTSTTVIGWVSGLGGFGLNTITKVGNIGALTSSLLILCAAMLVWWSAPLAKTTGRPRVVITTYTAGGVFVALVTLLAIWNVLIPTFFDASGPTVLRQTIFGMAAFLMGVSAVWMALIYIRSKSDFPFWFCLGLALITLAFTLGIFSGVLSDSISWLSRISQYFSGIYLIIAGLVAGAEARKKGVELHEVIAEFGRQAKVNYEILVNAASDAIIAIDGLGRVLAWNPAAEKMFCYLQNEIIGLPFFNLISSPEQVDAYQNAAGTVKPSSDSSGQMIELKARRKSGEEFPIELTLVPKKRMMGWLPTTTLIVRDITERKKAEEGLRQERDFNAAILNNTAALIIVLNTEGKIIHFNGAGEAITGYTEEEVKGRVFWEFLIPQDQLVGVMQGWEKLKQKEFPSQYENHWLTKDGRQRLIAFSNTVLLQSDGQIRYIVATGVDITERKKAEEALKESEDRFRTLANNIPQLAWMADGTGGLFWYNQRWYDYTGTNLEEMKGWGWQKVHHPDYVQPVTEKFKQHVATGEVWEDTFPLRGKDGIYRWFLSRAIPIQDTQGKVVRWFGTNTDITEKLKTEEELKRYNTELEAANKELEAFSYSITHDLKQPIRALESFSGLLAEDYRDKLDERGKDYLNRVTKASQYMSQLTDDMLKLSRINRADMYRDQVDLSSIAQSITEELRADQLERKAEIKIAPDLMAVGDKNLLTIVLRNLLENAWKFTRKCPQTQLEVGTMEKDGERVYFIRDNGIGFDMRYKDKLFQPFQRLTTDKDYPGTGIGLAIVQRVIHRHGGKIWAESEKEQGTTFYFTLS